MATIPIGVRALLQNQPNRLRGERIIVCVNLRLIALGTMLLTLCAMRYALCCSLVCVNLRLNNL